MTQHATLKELMEQAEATSPEREPVAAMRINRGILELDPRSDTAYVRLARALASRRRLGAALLACRRAQELNPGNKAAGRRLEQLERQYRQQVWAKQFATFADAYRAGLDKREVEQAEYAIACLWRALELASSDEQRIGSQVSLAAAYRSTADRTDSETAERLYREILKMQPHHRAASVGLGAALRDRGELGQAAAIYGKVLDRDPTDSAALVGLAAVRKDQGVLSEGEQLYKRALHLSPDNIYAQRGLAALVHEQQTRMREDAE